MINEDYYDTIKKIVDISMENDYVLSAWDWEFINSWPDKIELGPDQMRVSEKQADIFDRIQKKLEKHGEWK